MSARAFQYKIASLRNAEIAVNKNSEIIKSLNAEIFVIENPEILQSTNPQMYVIENPEIFTHWFDIEFPSTQKHLSFYLVFYLLI